MRKVLRQVGPYWKKDSLSSENFLRKDAYLAIVYVSDEEDQSQGDVSDYVKTFKRLKGK